MQRDKANLLSLRDVLTKGMINVSEACEVMIFLNLLATSLISFNVLRQLIQPKKQYLQMHK